MPSIPYMAGPSTLSDMDMWRGGYDDYYATHPYALAYQPVQQSFGTYSTRDGAGRKSSIGNYSGAMNAWIRANKAASERKLMELYATAARFGTQPDQNMVNELVNAAALGPQQRGPIFGGFGNNPRTPGFGRGTTYEVPRGTSPGGLKTTRRMSLGEMTEDQMRQNAFAEALNQQGDQQLRRDVRQSEIDARTARIEDRRKALELAEIKLKQSGAIARAKIDSARLTEDEKLALAEVARIVDEHPDPRVKARAEDALRMVARGGIQPQQALASIEAAVQVDDQAKTEAIARINDRESQRIQRSESLQRTKDQNAARRIVADAEREALAVDASTWPEDIKTRYKAVLAREIADAKAVIAGSGDEFHVVRAGISRPQTDEDYLALPSGSLYIDPDDGKTYRKP